MLIVILGLNIFNSKHFRMNNYTKYISPFLRLQVLSLMVLSVFVAVGCNDDKGDDPDGDGRTDKVLVIRSGSQSVEPGSTFQYEAQFVYSDGEIQPANNVEWSVSSTEFGSITSGGLLNVTATTGFSYVTATVTEGENTFTAEVPVRVAVSTPLVVAPWAIIGQAGDTYQLEAFLPTAGSQPSFSYSASDAGIASVSSSGLVTLNAVGKTSVTVTSGQNTITVPVLVVSAPTVSLPVARVEVAPSESIFRGETLQLSATAYDTEGGEASVGFNWSSSNSAIASVDDNGLVTGNKIGSASIRAEANGIIGEAQIEVLPDTVVIIDPIYVSVGQGASQTFNATVYNARTQTEITSHAPLNWELPSFPPPADIMNIGSISTSGTDNTTATLTVDDNALPGLSSVIIAWVGNNKNASGGASVMVAVSDPTQDCGPGNADVDAINISNGTSIDLSLFAGPFQHQIQFEAVDANGDPVSSPSLRFKSSNLAVADVDDNGLITATGNGTATITVCSGNFASTTLTVNVQ